MGHGWAFSVLETTLTFRGGVCSRAYFLISAWFLTRSRSPDLPSRRPMQYGFLLLVSIMVFFFCVFLRFQQPVFFSWHHQQIGCQPRLRNLYPAKRQLVIPRQTPTWIFRGHGALLLYYHYYYYWEMRQCNIIYGRNKNNNVSIQYINIYALSEYYINIYSQEMLLL